MKENKETDMPNVFSSLQYSFLIGSEGRIFTCDQLGRDFLSKIDLGLFYSQIQSIKINSAITSTTILIGNTSYNLSLVPLSLDNEFTDLDFPNDILILKSIAYIAILQNQRKLSEIYKLLNQMPLIPEEYENTYDALMPFRKLRETFEDQSCGLFIANAQSVVVYVNSMYENFSGFVSSEIVGKKLKDLNKQGIVNPIITPTILETGKVFTTMQKYATGKNAISSGAPIYDSRGKPILTITCVNSLDKISPADFPNQFCDTKNLRMHINKRMLEQPIDIIAKSPDMGAIVQDAIMVAQHDVSVLILGESGVGKEVIAAIIHAASQRNGEKFVKINCSSITPSLLESELFGYEPGSFTGALAKGKMGFFEVANNGTLLLDEIGDMPFELQSKLLRVLQDKEVYRVGGVTPIQVNVRIISSTNKNLENLISEGKFRQDLYYRLKVVSIDIPPLRCRREDIKPLLLHFNYLCNRKYYTTKVFSDDLIKILEDYQWIGNIRELQNVVEMLTVLCLENVLLPEHFYAKCKPANYELPSEEGVHISKMMHLKDAVAATEKILVTKAMKLAGNTRAAAELLDVSQSTIMRKFKEHAIEIK